MSHPGQHTLTEILSQPSAWAEALQVGAREATALRALWLDARADSLLFTGCGSTYYLSLAAAALARRRGLPARAIPASELWLGSDPVTRPDRTLLVAVSRSGETSETLRAIESFRRAGGVAVAAVTCYPDRAMVPLVDHALALPAAQEVSVAQTRSFASMLVACQMLVGALSGDEGQAERLAGLPEAGRRLITSQTGLAEKLGGDRSLERFFFLGNGPLYGLAEEAMLKMKEMSLSYSEGYHTLEFRHGPMSMADHTALVVGLLSDATAAQECAVLADMGKLGAHTLALTEGDAAAANPDHTVPLNAGLAVDDCLVLYLPFLQLLAFHRAVAKGLDPDSPRNLVAAVVLT